ncbi:hypothetical protein [Dyadobacter sp. 50-39]|uniref:hypothetical protein n=1 Tax=Dyadobacter sp. 50-39 TaxID=1895756 RepID=UPI000A7A3227|nr:hypothetical protein [Dyadobacter sp. 50-39]
MMYSHPWKSDHDPQYQRAGQSAVLKIPPKKSVTCSGGLAWATPEGTAAGRHSGIWS